MFQNKSRPKNLTTFVLDIQLLHASLKLSWVGGWLAFWVVGNCDFNENPVVHLDLDFDLGFVNKCYMIFVKT